MRPSCSDSEQNGCVVLYSAILKCLAPFFSIFSFLLCFSEVCRRQLFEVDCEMVAQIALGTLSVQRLFLNAISVAAR